MKTLSLFGDDVSQFRHLTRGEKFTIPGSDEVHTKHNESMYMTSDGRKKKIDPFTEIRLMNQVSEATWHQNKGPYISALWHPHTSKWKVVTDPINKMASSMTFDKKDEAEAFMTGLQKYQPDEHKASFIIPPREEVVRRFDESYDGEDGYNPEEDFPDHRIGDHVDYGRGTGVIVDQTPSHAVIRDVRTKDIHRIPHHEIVSNFTHNFFRKSKESEEKPKVESYDLIKKNSTVHYMTPQGQVGKGKAVMKGEHGWVLNAGGKGGSKVKVVNSKNYIPSKEAKNMKESFEALITAASNKDAVAFESTMTSILNAKLMEKISDYKVEVASNLYSNMDFNTEK